MKVVTRFNPTTSGPLHIGHLYCALVNRAQATAGDGDFHERGEFILRIDDSQPYWRYKYGPEVVDTLGDDYVRQLSKFMEFDKVERQTQLPNPRRICDIERIEAILPRQRWHHEQVAIWVPDRTITTYPYAPHLTLEKVVWDFWDGVNTLIRAIDLATETNLYDFFADALGLPRVNHYILGRLVSPSGKEFQQSISKTFGSYKLQTQIDKLGVGQTLHLLAKSCLIDPESPWLLANVRPNPVLVPGFIEN